MKRERLTLPMWKNFADNITQYRKNNGYTKTKMAKLLGVSVKTINRFETGEVSAYITTKTLSNACALTNMLIKELFNPVDRGL